MTNRLNKAEFMISLAAKAGKVVSGETSVEKAIQSVKAYLVIVSGDASENTRKKFVNKSNYYGIPVYINGTKESLAHAIGKDLRSVIAVTDEGMANAVAKKLEEMDVHGENEDI